jgi:hypothetical protein
MKLVFVPEEILQEHALFQKLPSIIRRGSNPYRRVIVREFFLRFKRVISFLKNCKQEKP